MAAFESKEKSPVKIAYSWEKISTNVSLVTGRSKHTAVAYKDNVFIFGGRTASVVLNDFLKFDVSQESWQTIIGIGQPPDPRCQHTAVVHENSMFVFGGFTDNLSNGYKNDLIEFNFLTGEWINWTTEGDVPESRSAHGAVVYDGKMWVFGGFNGFSRLNDMWTIKLSGDTKGWTKVFQNGDIPPICSDFPLSVAQSKMYFFSGYYKTMGKKTLYQFCFEKCNWIKIIDNAPLESSLSPPSCFGHTMVVANQCLYFFGGAYSGGILEEHTRCFDLNSQVWSIITPSGEIPRGRAFHAAVSVSNAMYIFGGTDDDNVRSGEMYRLNFFPTKFGKLTAELTEPG